MADRLGWVKVDLHPQATCDNCAFHRVGNASWVTADAKRHAREMPGHVVVVERVSRSVYEVPAEDKAASS